MCPIFKELPLPPENRTGWPWTEESQTSSGVIAGTFIWPKISIVTPNYNYSQFIEETIRSVLLQNYPNFEYIVIDDGSTDRSVEIIKKYDSWLTHWETMPNQGQANAINRGFMRTTGEIMAWINSDDIYMPGAFYSIAEVFSAYNDIKWLSGYSCVSDIGRETTTYGTCYKNLYDFISGDYKWIQQESVFWKRSLWEMSGGRINEEYKFQIDGELWTRFFEFESLWYINRVLGIYRMHDSNRAKIYAKEMDEEMEIAITRLRQKHSLSPRDTHFLKYQRIFKKALGVLRLKTFYQENFSRIYGNNYKRLILENGSLKRFG